MTPQDLARLRKMSLADKIEYSKTVIREFYERMDGKGYVSFSGGKDSTVLLHLVRSIYPDTPGMFIDTGLEYPEILEHVKTFDNIRWMPPKRTYGDVIQTYGYPVIGKVCSHWIGVAQRGGASGIRQMGMTTQFGFLRYQYMVDAPFKVSDRCCDVLKKEPIGRYERETKRSPYIGTRTEESAVRKQTWLVKGDNQYDKSPKSNPISIWNRTDVEAYTQLHGLPVASIYDVVDRTGCVFCMYRIMKDKQRFVMLKATHPDLHEMCMKPLEEGGLGMKPVLEFMNIPTGCEQCTLTEYNGEKKNDK